MDEGALFWSLSSEEWLSLLYGLLRTLAIVGVGMVVAMGLGGVWAFVGGVLGKNGMTKRAWDGVQKFVRGTPIFVQLVFVFYAIPSGAENVEMWVACGVFGFHYSFYTVEAYRSALDAVERGQIDAARSLGLRPVQVFLRVKGPQALSRVVAPLGNHAASMLKETPIVTVIAVGDLFFEATKIGMSNYSFVAVYSLVGLVYLALSFVVSYGAKGAESRIRRRRGLVNDG